MTDGEFTKEHACRQTFSAQSQKSADRIEGLEYHRFYDELFLSKRSVAD